MQFVNSWPADQPEFKEKCSEYQRRLITLSRQLIRIIALALGAEESYFDKMVTAPLASLKLQHYPPQDLDSSIEIGAPAHTDFESRS